MLQTPILLITFNRPDHVRKALMEIRTELPTELFIAQDGPRADRLDDVQKIQAVREAIKEIVDWPCNLHTLYQEKNLGCGRGPYEAMSWFFQQVEYGIILEDDIVPHKLFWHYMEELLGKYRDDTRVGMVCGHNLHRYYSRHNSYYFTYEMEGTLGWGTWRRVWEKFDFMIPYNAQQLDAAMRDYGMPYLYRQKLNRLYKGWLSTNRHDCWDYQFDYFLLVNRYLNVRANSCLTSHEGDDADATHIGFGNPGYKMDVNETLFEKLIHPKKIAIDRSEKHRMYKQEIKLLAKKILGRQL